ncbi:unnamed protein product [Colias eurytheme]|nr:unnamed protein product [Colias eurytheme]
MATSISTLIPVEKLSGIENYSNWKFQLKMLLIHEDLWDVVTEDKTEDVNDAAYMKRSQKALAKICLSVKPSVFTHVRNAETARDAWINLQKAYEDKGLSRRLSLLRLLFETKLCDCESMEAYVAKISDLSQQLNDIGSPLEDDFVAVLLLSGLSQDFDPLIMALENSNIKLSSEVVKAKLMQEKQRRDGKGDTTSTALVVARKKIKCFKCKKLGHYSRDCKNMKAVKAESSTNQSLLTALSASVQSDVWIIDSGASSHMCNDRNKLNNFVPGYVTEVKVANGEKLFTAGRGDVIVNLKLGIKTISEVYHVPNLATNLLSVSALTRKGFKVIFDKKCCKIFNGNKLAATAVHKNGVYQLETAESVRERDLCVVGCGGCSMFSGNSVESATTQVNTEAQDSVQKKASESCKEETERTFQAAAKSVTQET